MNAKVNSSEEKQRTWHLLEKIIGQTERAVSYRSDLRIHSETDTSILVTFSKTGQLFYDVSRKDLERLTSQKRSFFVFLAGSHKEIFIVPSAILRQQIKMHGLTFSQKYEDYKLHLVRDYGGTYFREIPSLNLALFLNQYAQLL